MAGASVAAQQSVDTRQPFENVHVLDMEPLEKVPAITGAPSTADATTEFTQMLADGNRIERRYSTTIARDSQGRTRREQQMALVGPLAVLRLDGPNAPVYWKSGGRGAGAPVGDAPPQDAGHPVVGRGRIEPGR